MARYNEDRSKVVYSSYEEYEQKQDARFHDYDCPNCLRINKVNMLIALRHNPGILSILDMGSRDSAYFDEMKQGGIECTGIDISPRSVEYAKSKNRNVVLGDAAEIKEIFKNMKFDLIMSCHSLEHFLEPKKIIKDCYDLLNNNGLILVRLPDEGPQIRDTQNHFAHTSTWSWDEVIKLIKDSGFKVIDEKRNFPNEIFVVGRKVVRVPTTKDLPLYFVPNDNWMPKYNEVLKDPFVNKKYNREIRLKDKIEYVWKLAPEVMIPGYVLDLGPGPGEFLEVCRYYDNKIEGVDSAPIDNLMGFEYLDLSILMTQRQKIPVEYVGFENLLSDKLPWDDGELSFINSQGSIEQIFCKHIKGNMRDKDYTNVYWTMDNGMEQDFSHMFSEVRRVLRKDGIFLVFANGTGNTKEYSEMMEKIAVQVGFNFLSIPEPYDDYEYRIHKMKKASRRFL